MLARPHSDLIGALNQVFKKKLLHNYIFFWTILKNDLKLQFLLKHHLEDLKEDIVNK